MTTPVTQCPKCHTSFRVTEAQLNIANGAVRCGSCLHIFNAAEYWLDASQAKPADPIAPAETPPPPPTEQSFDEDLFDGDLFDIDSLDDESKALNSLDDDSFDLDSISDDPLDADSTDDDSSDVDSIDEDSIDVDSIDVESIDGDSLDIESIDDDTFDDETLDDDSSDDDSLFNESNAQQSLESIFEDGDFDDDNYLDQLGSQLLDEEPEGDDDQPQPVESAESIEQLSDNPGQITSLSLDVYEGDDEVEDDDSVNVDDYLLDDNPDIDDDEIIEDTQARSIINIEDDLLDDFESSSSSDSDEDSSNEFSSYFLALDQQESKASAIFKELDDMGDADSEDQDSWAKKLLEEAEQEPEIDRKARRPRAEEQPEDQFENLFDSLEEDQPGGDLQDPELLDILNEDTAEQPKSTTGDTPGLGSHAMAADANSNPAKKAMLANIEPEPVEFASKCAASARTIWARRATMGGIVAAVLLLALQYLLFNFDRLARDNSYRPLLASGCELLGCTLPAIDDISLVRSSNLVIRSHPNIQQALVVDAIMTNHAEFKQPFPVMELQFMDLGGRIIADRRFQPREYLAGELLGSQTMPVKQPVHIALQIVDPGEQAVNYQLRFHSSRGL